jgi:hypothetical protein
MLHPLELRGDERHLRIRIRLGVELQNPVGRVGDIFLRHES